MKKDPRVVSENPFTPYKNVKYERTCFEKIALHLTQVHRIPKAHLNGWKLKIEERDTLYEPVTELAYTLKNFILHGEKKYEDWQEFPATWLDHLKLHLNTSYGFKFKVRMSRFARKIINMRYCPHVSNDNRTHIEFLQFNNDGFYGDPRNENEVIK